MVGELEALVRHLFVVGGRAISTTPPGALVETPPKKAQRGREGDTFFTLVTPAGAVQAQAAFYEQLAKRAADLYFRSGGGVTSGLREAATGINDHLLTHNGATGQRFQANMICLVLRGREVYIARAGACLCLLRQGDHFTTAPDDPRDEYALNGLPLGYSPSPDIKLNHYEIAPGHVMVLSDVGLAAADRAELNGALGMGKVEAIQEKLKPLAAPRTQAMIVEFAIVDPAVAASPVAPAPVAGAKVVRPPTPSAASAPAAPVTATSAVPIPESKPIPAKPPAKPAEPRPAQQGAPLILRAVQFVIRRVKRAAAWFLSGIARFLNAILDRLLPEPEDNKPHIPATVAAGLAILIPVLVVFIVVALRLTQVDQTNFEVVVGQVQDQANQALHMDQSNPDKVKLAWYGVLQRIEQAKQLQRPGAPPDPVLAKIQAQAQAVLDGYAKVTRRPTVALHQFNVGAKLASVVVQGGTDVYTLDVSQSAIYRDALRQPDQIGTRSSQPIVQIGSAVGSYTVKHIVDMLWMNEGGIPNSHALVALDTQGILVTYSPTFAPAISQPLDGSERWSSPVALASWQDRLYILDPGANQIWRYVPSGTTYPNPPEEYFTQEYQRKLANAVDFAIDEKGNVYILFNDGTIKKYNGGAEQPFSLEGLPEGNHLKSANAIYLDASSPLPAIFVTDPVDQSVYEFTLSGAFVSRFRSTDPNAFTKLTAVFADGSNVYVASGPVLYYFATGGQAAAP